MNSRLSPSLIRECLYFAVPILEREVWKIRSSLVTAHNQLYGAAQRRWNNEYRKRGFSPHPPSIKPPLIVVEITLPAPLLMDVEFDVTGTSQWYFITYYGSVKIIYKFL